MILVTGARGNVGSEVVTQVGAGGEVVRALVRAEDARVPDAAQAAVGDLNDPDSLAAALDDVRAVFLLSGYKDMPGLLARIRGAGIERVVLLSGGSAVASSPDNAISRYMIDSEHAVRTSGLAWTILRPYAFMSNALRWAVQIRKGDVVKVAFAAVANAVIDPYDIARVATRALLSDDHDGQVYRLSGPDSLLPANQLATLGAVLGRDLRLEAQPDAEARAEMANNMPAEYVDAFFSFYVDHTLDESQVLPAVADITGSPPRSFEQWARVHADAFR
ncbi:MAG: NAD(P)H-binding protein [Acidimicrobiaceae bacterium]|nr:NAD(P)H-binding protein [Acidimicrobiaceae bacterium]